MSKSKIVIEYDEEADTVSFSTEHDEGCDTTRLVTAGVLNSYANFMDALNVGEVDGDS